MQELQFLVAEIIWHLIASRKRYNLHTFLQPFALTADFSPYKLRLFCKLMVFSRKFYKEKIVEVIYRRPFQILNVKDSIQFSLCGIVEKTPTIFGDIGGFLSILSHKKNREPRAK